MAHHEAFDARALTLPEEDDGRQMSTNLQAMELRGGQTRKRDSVSTLDTPTLEMISTSMLSRLTLSCSDSTLNYQEVFTLVPAILLALLGHLGDRAV